MRLKWCRWVLKQSAYHLSRWAYSDGTVFYLARSAHEVVQKARLALGPQVWRHAHGHDSLFEDVVGPSSYAKAQGQPVRVWGLLMCGVLYISILPAGECMNRHWYAWIIKERFRAWIRKTMGPRTRMHLVQDHERALWTKEPREAMADANIDLLDKYRNAHKILIPSKQLGASSARASTKRHPLGVSSEKHPSSDFAEL